MTEPLRVFFVDDHPVVSAGLALRFATVPGFAVVGTAATFREAIDHVTRHKDVDVAIVDVQLEVALTPRQVQALAEHTRVVLFSARSTDPVVQHLLAAGACAALDKATPLARLDAVLRDVCTRPLNAAAVATASTPTTSASRHLELLSPREREIFLALVRCQTPKEVADSFGLARSTVYCHIDRIRQKLGVETLQELVALELTGER